MVASSELQGTGRQRRSIEPDETVNPLTAEILESLAPRQQEEA